MIKKILPLAGMALGICMMASHCFAQDIPVPKSDNSPNQREQVKTIFSFKNEIGITDDQELKLKALLYDEQSFFDTNGSKLKTLGTELNGMVEKKEDMQAVKSKLEEIANVQVEVSYRNIEDRRKIEAILSPDQLAKWRDIQKKYIVESKT